MPHVGVGRQGVEGGASAYTFVSAERRLMSLDMAPSTVPMRHAFHVVEVVHGLENSVEPLERVGILVVNVCMVRVHWLPPVLAAIPYS